MASDLFHRHSFAGANLRRDQGRNGEKPRRDTPRVTPVDAANRAPEIRPRHLQGWIIRERNPDLIQIRRKNQPSTNFSLCCSTGHTWRPKISTSVRTLTRPRPSRSTILPSILRSGRISTQTSRPG